MDVSQMGKVAAASTSIENGFEHHWRLVVEAAGDYVAARADLAEAERSVRELADGGAQTFAEAARQLSVRRPSLCPPGAWGCVAVVARGESAVTPSELTSAFVSSGRPRRRDCRQQRPLVLLRRPGGLRVFGRRGRGWRAWALGTPACGVWVSRHLGLLDRGGIPGKPRWGLWRHGWFLAGGPPRRDDLTAGHPTRGHEAQKAGDGQLPGRSRQGWP